MYIYIYIIYIYIYIYIYYIYIYILYILYMYLYIYIYNLIFKIYWWVGESIRPITGSTRISRIISGLGSFLTFTEICNFFQPNLTRTRDKPG